MMSATGKSKSKVEASVFNIQKQITTKHQKLKLYQRNSALNAKEGKELIHLLEMHAFSSEWERVIELASQGVVLGCGLQEELRLYRIWIEGLNEDMHVDGLQELGEHLWNRKREGVEFAALSLLCFGMAGKINSKKTALQYLYRQDNCDNKVVEECVGLASTHALEKEERLQGLKTLRNIIDNSFCGYFSMRAMFNAAVENNDLNFASLLLKKMINKYPLAPEPYHISGLLAVTEGKWEEASLSFKENLRKNPFDTDTIILISRCLELQGKHIEARNFLRARTSLFAPDDYEFNLQLGMVEKKLFEEIGNETFRTEAVKCFEQALKAAEACRMPELPLVIQLENLGARERIKTMNPVEEQKQRYWLIELSARSLIALLERKQMLLSCPLGVENGDILFFTPCEANKEKTKQISGLFKVKSAPRLDSNLGCVVEISNSIAFDKPVSVKKDDKFTSVTNAMGIKNFSRNRKAFFYELHKKVAEEIIEKLEIPTELGLVHEAS